MARITRQLSRLDEIHQELKVITLRKESPEQSLGFTIVGGDDKKYGSGIFIKQVLENGLAGKSGKLKTGDKILWVDEHNIESVSHKEAAWLLQHTSEVVELIVSQTKEKKSILDENGFSPLGCAQLVENMLANDEPLVFEVRYILDGQK